MALKVLKFNMIFGGNHYAFGTVLEESEIPSNLRKAKYLLEPEETSASASEEEEELVIDEEDLDFLEEIPKPPLPKRKPVAR